MYKKLFIFVCLIFTASIISYSQPSNDNCDSPINISSPDLESGACNGFDNISATFDLANGDCSPNVDDINVWFEFTALAVDITIDASSSVGTPIITLLEFDPTPCDFASAIQFSCTASTVELFDALTIGNQYYIIITLSDMAEGDFDLCVENPTFVPGPPNDDPCTPDVITADGSCYAGTTINANPNFTGPGECTNYSDNSVWFEVFVAPGFNSITIDLNDISLMGEVSVLVGTLDPDCNGQFILANNGVYCGNAGTDIIDADVLGGNTYYIQVSTSSDGEGDFEICAEQFGPDPCVSNDLCTNPDVLFDSPGGGATCLNGECNIGASPGPEFNPPAGCYDFPYPTVWYTYTPDPTTTFAQIEVVGITITNPQIAIFQTDCSVWTQLECITNAGTATINNFAVTAGQTYIIGVSDATNQEGEFDICIAAFEGGTNCNTSSSIEVISTSLGSPLDGPYLPGEDVQVCLNILDWDSGFSTNNCQWLHGIVPEFSDCWDASSFNATTGEPNNVTVPLVNVSSGNWQWFADGVVTYNTISGGYYPPETPVGGGWFNINLAGDCSNCLNFADPNCTWGDGFSCSDNNTTTWQVCFMLTTKMFPECGDDPEFSNCTVNFRSFGDGETGGWCQGGALPAGIAGCQADLPWYNNLSLNCCEGPILDDVTQAICPGESTSLQLTSNQDPDVNYSWTVIDNPNVTGEADGEGAFITQLLDNLTNSTQYVTYLVTPTSITGCPSPPMPIIVEVLAGITVDAGADIDGCAQGEFELGGTPTAIGGNGGPYTYDWGNPNVPNNSNPTVSPNLSTTYTVTVTDGNGCTSTDEVLLDINPNFGVEVNGVIEVCASTDPASFTQLTATPDGGMPNHNYLWNNPSGANGNQQVYLFNYNNLSSGIYNLTVEVTDDNGCTGSQEVAVLVHAQPAVYVLSIPTEAEMCDGGSVQLIGSSSSDGNGDLNVYNWSDPDGDPINGELITVFEPGIYTLTVTDEFGCTGESSAEVVQVEDPEPTILAPSGVCDGDSILIEVEETFDIYDWSNGEVGQMISVQAGTYTVTVTDQAGCTGTEIVTINPFSPPVADIGGSSTFCEGSSTILNVNSGLDTYIWLNENGDTLSNADTLLVLVGGTYFVTVSDDNGCTSASSQLVTQQEFLEPNVLGDTSLCPMDCSVLDAGDGFSTYIWSTGDSTKTITVCDPGDYTVTVTDAGGCFGTSVTTIIVNTPPEPVIDGTNEFCPSGNTDLDAGMGYASYEWSTLDSTQNINVDTPGIYMVTVTDLENCTGTAEIEVFENTSPTPTLDGILEFCPGDSVELTTELGFDLYEVDLDNNGSVDLSDTTGLSFFVDYAGNINLMVTDSNGCTGEILVSTLIYTPPQPTIAADTASFCVDGSVSVSAEDGYVAYDWEFEDGTDAGDDQVLIADQAGIYTVMVTDTNGCTGLASTVIIQSDELYPAILGDTSICDGIPIILDAGIGYDVYDWESGEDSQTISVADPGLYTVTVYDNSGCSGIDQINVVSNVTPSAVVEPEAFICNDPAGLAGTILDLSSLVTGSGGIWADDDLTGVDLNDITTVDFENIPIGIYTFSYTTNSAIQPCVNQTYYLELEVDDCDCPNVSTMGAGPLCEGSGTIDLTSLELTTESGSWSLVNGPGGNPISGDVFDAGNAVPGDYTIAFEIDNTILNCDSISEQIITVIAAPNVGIADIAQVICLGEGQNFDLASLLTGEDSGGTWSEISSVPSTGGAFDAAAGTFNTDGQIAGDYTFEYLLLGTAPCNDDVSDPVMITIESLPVADAGSDQQLDCDVPDVSIGGSATSTGSQYDITWSELSGIAINDDITNAVITVDEPGTYIIEVEDNINGCISWDTIVVGLNANLPVLSAEANDISCFGANDGIINVVSIIGGDGNYEYSIDGGASWSSNDEFTGLAGGNYTIIVQDGSSCQDEIDLTIVEPSALILELGDNQIINPGQTIQLDLASAGVDIADLSNVVWTENGVIVCEGLSCVNFEIETSEDATYCVEITNTNGCTIDDCIEVRIQVNYEIYTPNIFSPNNDGVNDFFYVQTGTDVINVSYFAIYDRWGELLFENENFEPNNPGEGWDGTFNSKTINPGVYIFVTEVEFQDGEILTKTGDITVIK